jgi:hypothetical protein
MGASYSKSFSRINGPKGTKATGSSWGLGWISHSTPPPQRRPEFASAIRTTRIKINSATEDPTSNPAAGGGRNDSNIKKSA